MHIGNLSINGGCTEGIKGRTLRGEMPRSRSLVKAFDLIPVVEQVLPDRQKTEVRQSDLSAYLDVGYPRANHCLVIQAVLQGPCH